MLRRRSFVAAGGALMVTPQNAFASEPREFEVDIALALLIDVSVSVSEQRWALQKFGYASAFRDAAILQRITAGERGVAAVAAIQWSSCFQQVRAAGWKKIHSRQTAEEFARELESMHREYRGSTAIGPALIYGAEQFRLAPTAKQKVIDISGDGKQESESDGNSLNIVPSVESGRAYALDRGIIINGLPIMLQAPADGSAGAVERMNQETLWEYKKNVIGGPDSFYLVLDDPDDEEKVVRAIRRKLLRESGM